MKPRARTVPRSLPTRPRLGLTLPELLIAIVAVTMIMGAVATLSEAVRSTQQVVGQTSSAVQHARLALHRIRHHIETATANQTFPGVVVFGDQVGSYTFPDILVVWHPTSAAADPEGLPRWNELVVYGADARDPHRLVEVTWPNDSQTVPALSEIATWQQRLDAGLRGEQGQQVLLTDQLRTATVAGRRSRLGESNPAPAGAVLRFDAELVPSAEQWNAFEAGRIAWSDLAWSQGLQSETTGLRHHWCRIELQLRGEAVDSADAGLPFYDSAVVYFEVHRP